MDVPCLCLANGDVELDFRIADDGHYRLTDRKTGEVYEAPDLGLVKTWDQTEDRFRHTLLLPTKDEFWSEGNAIAVERISDTRAILHANLGGEGSASAMGGVRLGVHFDIEVTLDGHRVEFRIPEESFVEKRPERFRVFSIELLPSLGATPAGAPGYLFIPTRSGAVYYFDRDDPRAYKAYGAPGSVSSGTAEGVRLRWGHRPDASAEYGSLVYGEQGKWEDLISLPLYGTFRQGSALAGMVLGGEYDTEIVARRDFGPDRRASVSPRFHYRYFWNSKRDTVSRRLRLELLRGESANYSGAANAYRNYLVDEAGVRSLAQRAAGNPAIDYFRDSLYFRVMFGMTYRVEGATECDPATRKGYETRCSQHFDELREAIFYFKEAGLQKVSFIGTGANTGGHDWAHPTIFPLEPVYGGEESFKRLVRTVNDAGYTFGVHVNYKDVYDHSPDWRDDAIQRNEWGDFRFHGAWMGGYSYQGIPHKMHEYYVKRDLPRLRDLGLRGFFYFDAIGAVMEESFPPGEPICRREYGEGMNAYIEEGNRLFGCAGNEVSIAGSLGTIVHSNIFYAGGAVKEDASGYRRNGLLDHSVPVQHMVFHGLCLYGGGAEVGGMAGGGSWGKTTREDVEKGRRAWEQAQAWGGATHYAFFVDHRELAPGITRSAFSDGTVTLANRTETDWSDGTHTVPAKGHLVLREGGNR